MKTIPFPQFCSKDSTPFSAKVDCQKLVNLYRETVQSGDGENDFCLIKTPGLRRAVRPSGANGANRGSYEINGRLFQVIADRLYSIDSNYSTITNNGPANNDGLPVMMAASTDTLMLVSGGLLYRVNGGTLSLMSVPFTPIGIGFIKNYFVALSSVNQQFFYSTDDGATWPALNFQTAEAAANAMIAMIIDHEELWLIGNRISQVYVVGTDPNTPFVARQDAVIQQGTAAAASVVALDNSLFWIGKNKNGERTVIRTNGFNPENVSTYAVNNTLRGFSRVDDAIGQAYQLNGHSMVRFTFPAADRTLEYDATENDWHEVAYRNVAAGTYSRHRGNTIVSAFGKILVGDHTNGWLYEMSPDVYDEQVNDALNTPIRWNRRCPHLVKDGKKVEYGRLDVFAEMGMGLNVVAGQPGFDPQIAMRFSDDAGNTFSSVFSRSLGKQGEYRKKAYWNRLGTAEDRVFDFYGDSPTKIVFTGATFDAELLDA